MADGGGMGGGIDPGIAIGIAIGIGGGIHYESPATCKRENAKCYLSSIDSATDKLYGCADEALLSLLPVSESGLFTWLTTGALAVMVTEPIGGAILALDLWAKVAEFEICVKGVIDAMLEELSSCDRAYVFCLQRRV